MVKMIGKDLSEQSGEDNKYIFLEFNAWLYQGYEDAKSALLQSVTIKLTEEIKKQGIDENDKLGKKFKRFLKRINGFRYQNWHCLCLQVLFQEQHQSVLLQILQMP